MRRMMLIAASWPSNSDAAVTKRTLLVGRYSARALCSADRSVTAFSSAGRAVLLQGGEVLFEELQWRLFTCGTALRFLRAQFDAADLSGDRLRQLCELQPADALVWREVRAQEREDVFGELCRRREALAQHDVALGHGQPYRVRT